MPLHCQLIAPKKAHSTGYGAPSYPVQWRFRTLLFPLFALLALDVAPGFARDFRAIPTEPKAGDLLLDAYWKTETTRLTEETRHLLFDEAEWKKAAPRLKEELHEMLGLSPFPEKTDLKPVITGTLHQEGVIIEKLQFQSKPGLYVTANYYRPEKQEGPLPTILYVCGHGNVVENGVSLGNKATYQHHPLWFAKNGYTCLIIDTLQLGEIAGIHHGTYRYNRWWWLSRGYTSAGVEAWNGIRALDYLETRPEVDREKIGITGRSGGGAYTFWIAALDSRIKVAVPVAGITSMKNHVVDGCIEGHCDCMFMVNTYRWDFPLLAAAIAPRPLLIVNTDKDSIFPVDGVVDVYSTTAQVYQRLGKSDHLGLAFYEGPHKDTQPLRVSAFHWFERYLKGKGIDHEIESTTAPKQIKPADLRVFDQLPADQINTKIDETFTAQIAELPLPENEADWLAENGRILEDLRQKSFRAWPAQPEPLALKKLKEAEKDGVTLSAWQFRSQEPWDLPLYLAHRSGLKPEDLDLVVLNVLNEESWNSFLTSPGGAFPDIFSDVTVPALDEKAWAAEAKMHSNMKWGMAYLPPRGIGPTSWTSDEKERIQILRRFALLGATLEGMQTWDVRRSIQALRAIPGLDRPQIWIQSNGAMAGNALYASLFEEGVHRLDLHRLPSSHREGPHYLNVLRYTDLPRVVAMAAKNSRVRVYSGEAEAWSYPSAAVAKYGWENKPFEVRKPMAEEAGDQ